MKLKSYRGFILKLLIPFFVSFSIIIISYSICCAFLTETIERQDLIFLIIFIILDICAFCLILIIKFHNGANYSFETDSIYVYNGKKFIEKINIEDIETIYYHPFRFRYLITIFLGELMDGGAWKLHIKLYDGSKKELAFFSEKDVKLLKEQLYGELIDVK